MNWKKIATLNKRYGTHFDIERITQNVVNITHLSTDIVNHCIDWKPFYNPAYVKMQVWVNESKWIPENKK